MEYEKYKVIISEKAKNMLASNIAFIAKVSADAATNKKSGYWWYTIIRANAQTLSFFNEEYIPPNKYRKMFIKNGIWFYIKFKKMLYTLIIYLIIEKIING